MVGLGEATVQPSTARADRRRREILDAARTLVSQKGFRAARMDEVAAAIGVTKPAIYRYFPGKEQLILALMEEDLVKPGRLVSELIRAHPGPVRQLLEIVSQRVLQVQEGGLGYGYMALAMDEGAARPEIGAVIREQVLRPGLEAFVDAFKKAMERGELRSDQDPDLLCRLFFAPFMQLALIRGGFAVPLPSPEDQARYMKMHVDGFLRAYGA